MLDLGRFPYIKDGVVTDGDDVVVKITVPAGNTDFYKVEIFDATGTAVAGFTPAKSLANQAFTANQLKIATPGKADATYLVTVTKNDETEPFSKMVITNKDIVKPTFTATFTNYVAAVKATENVTVSTGAIKVDAVTAGAAGNGYKLFLVDPSANDAELSVELAGKNILVNLATDNTGNITSTLADVVAAVNAHADAKAVVVLSTTDNAVVATAVTSAGTATGADAKGAEIVLAFDKAMKADTTATIKIEDKQYTGTVTWATNTATVKLDAAATKDVIFASGNKIQAVSLVDVSGNAPDLTTPVLLP